MPTVAQALDSAIAEVTTARARISRVKTPQVGTADDKSAPKNAARMWFEVHRPVVALGIPAEVLGRIDSIYNDVLIATDRYAAKTTYRNLLHDLKKVLGAARSLNLAAPVAALSPDLTPPDFTPLVGNPEMRDILTRRWHECRKCADAGAHLAAVVMMGGFLEALFVARANQMQDKKKLVGAKSAPKDKATGKTINYQDWMLDSYIKVAKELKWITESAGDLADVLKEYRNYVHPAKEMRNGVVLTLDDSSVFWQLTKALVGQLLMSARTP